MIRDSGFYREASLHNTDCATQLIPRDRGGEAERIDYREMRLGFIGVMRCDLFLQSNINYFNK